jgi:WD40 repeat protein
VKKQLAFLLAGFVAAMLLAGQLARAAGGPDANDIEDSIPYWSSNGVDVAFQRTAAGQTSRILDMAAGGKSIHVVSDGQVRGWIPGTEHVLVQVDGVHTLVLSDSDRFHPPYAEFLGTDASASPDGSRVAYLRDGTLYVANVDGSGEHAVATSVAPPSWDITGPAWSPDSTRIAISSGSSLLLVNADGSGSRVLFTGANQSVDPSWSHDGSMIAFERNANGAWQIWTVRPDGTHAGEIIIGGSFDARYPQFSPVSDELAYISDQQHVRGGATAYRYTLYVRPVRGGGEAHALVADVHPYSPPRWSPTGALIAVSAGQECRRWGIYVTRPETGSRAMRRSNLCHVEGTPGPDVLRGSPYFDLMQGLGGNDTIYGGSGNDVIFGGPGDDVIVPGNGRDWIDCGAGHDVVEGAGPIDHIAKNCEVVKH